MSEWTNTVIAIVTAIIGLATLAVILSKQANTAQVIQTSTQGLSQLIGAAVAPVTGQSYSGLSTLTSPLS